MANESKQKETLVSIQILRSIAALEVVITHCSSSGFSIRHAGEWGVDIFFIISGFIIAYIASKDTDRFLIKRILRLAPLYYIATLLILFVGVTFPHLVYSTEITVEKFIKSMLFIPYVDELKQNLPILGQGWTLRFQIFFYFTVAFSLIILKNKKYLALLCAFVLLVFLVILNLFESVPFELEYYRAGLFPEFIYGLLLFFIYDYVKRQTKILDISSQSVKIICLSIVVICFAYLVGHDIFGITFSENPNLQKGIPSLILVIALLLIEKQINKQNKIVKFMILLGKASYAMYIFHYLIITVFTRIIFKKVLENNNLFFIEMIILLLTIASTIIISIYSYKLIDMPIQKKLRKLMAR